MTFEDIQRANSTIQTRTLTRKTKTGTVETEYADVNQRVKAFRILYPEGSITTDIISLQDGICVMKATVSVDGKVLGTGTAYEKEGNGFINTTSYIENCETSAIGRALAMCGIGIDTSICSYEEVANAKMQQEQKAEQTIDPRIAEADVKAKVMAYINSCGMEKEKIDKLCMAYGVKNIADMNAQHCNHYINLLKQKGIEI